MSHEKTGEREVRIALIQASDQGSVAANLDYTIERIREAAACGAQIISTQELFSTPYFCQIQNKGFFDLAEPVPGVTTEILCELAGELGVVLIASLFERRG